MRLLHSWIDYGCDRVASGESEPDTGRGEICHRWQSLPLHRLYQGGRGHNTGRRKNGEPRIATHFTGYDLKYQGNGALSFSHLTAPVTLKA